MLQTIVVSLLAGVGGLWLATRFIPGVNFSGSWQTFLMAGLALGVVLIIVRPFIGLISMFLRLLILGAVSFAALWVLQLVFPGLNLQGLIPLLSTTGAIIGISFVLSFFGKGKL